jgi:enoyl-CoA hydratase/carnithine racemase
MVLLADEERISAQTALRISLVTEVTKAEDLHARGREIALSIAARSPVPTQGSVRALWEAQSLPREQALANAVKYVQISKAKSAVKQTPPSLKSVPWKLR